MPFQKATLEKSRLRLAIYGPSGAGKTYTALRIASGMGGKIALIDTERRTARKYSRVFDFDVNELDRRTIEDYVQAIREAKGYNVLIIDSMSHAWQELLEEIDKLASTKFGGNTWSAWSKGTPKQRAFIDAILNFDGHVIATIRSKTDWDQVKDEKTGKIKPVRVGLSPEQGKGIEYEFDMLMSITAEHVAAIEKDRTGKFQDKMIEKPGEDFGAELMAWLSDGAPAPQPKPATMQAAALDLGGKITYEEPEELPFEPNMPSEPAPVAPPKQKMSLEMAATVKNREGVAYIDIPSDKLSHMSRAIAKAIKENGLDPEQKSEHLFKLDAIAVILQSRNEQPA